MAKNIGDARRAYLKYLNRKQHELDILAKGSEGRKRGTEEWERKRGEWRGREGKGERGKRKGREGKGCGRVLR